MVKSNKSRVSPVQKIVVKKKVKIARRKNVRVPPPPVFGPVTTIDTAPTSIGNTYQGATPIVVPTRDGIRIKGRDYFLTVDTTSAAVLGWTLVAGAPLGLGCMVTSSLKGFANTYGEYMIHGMAFHYITSNSTSDTGSLMMYIAKDRAGPGLITSSPNLLSVVLSDHNTTIGPIWKNNTALSFPDPQWLTTDVLNDEGLHEQAVGELFVLTKTGQLDTSGYILIDYDISFREMQTNIKQLTLPVSRMKYTQVILSKFAAVTTGVTNMSVLTNAGFLLDGVTVSSSPSGGVVGDVYKVIFNVTNATLTNVTAGTLFQYLVAGTGNAVTIADGFTCYMTMSGTSIGFLYPTYYAAVNGSSPFVSGVTATITIAIPAYISLVGSLANGVLQANY